MAPHRDYQASAVLSVKTAPDLTKCMQNTGGIMERSTFRIGRSVIPPTQPGGEGPGSQSPKRPRQQ
ncbi:MAG: hypothetical protein WCV68_03360 [Candidatus Paceibacterota bacterium]